MSTEKIINARAALWMFAQRFVSAWQDKYHSLPQSEAYLGLASDCIVQETDSIVIWQPVQREVFAEFENVENGIGLCLHEDIKSFYATLYSGDMKGKFNGNTLDLIQIWNEEDWLRLQENILGHLLMQKRLKQNPTVFIASTLDDQHVISICNVTGAVFNERIGTDDRALLAPDLATFLTQLEPEISEK